MLATLRLPDPIGLALGFFIVLSVPIAFVAEKVGEKDGGGDCLVSIACG